MQLTREALASELAVLDQMVKVIAFRRRILQAVSRSRAVRPDTFHPVSRATLDELEWVAHVYRCALVLRCAPKREVAADLGVSAASAGRWIAAARAQHVLEPDAVDPRGRLRSA